MADHNRTPAKKPHIAWRISQVFLHILGRIVLWVLILAGTLAGVAAIAASIGMTKFSDYLKTDVIPKAEEYADTLQLDNSSLPQTSILYSRDGATGAWVELQKLHAAENRIWVSYDEIPKDLVYAAVAIEDKRFLEHNGVDWLRTLSAVQNFVGGDSSYGASTITQQLIKNLSKEDDVTVNRKVQEIFRALAVEKRYTKEEILEWYLNTIYLGEGCYGVQSAAQVYFAKEVGELTTAECASLIAITNNPSLFDPYIRPANNRERQRIILSEMYAQGYIKTEADYETAKEQELVFRNGLNDTKTYLCANCGFEGKRSDYNKEDKHYFCPECAAENEEVDSNSGYSYFVDTVYRDVVDDLCEQYGLSELAAQQLLLTSGWSIYTTLDTEVQAQVDEIYENLDNVPKTVSIQQLQSAIVIVDNNTGDIVAMSGGVGEKEGSLTFNRAESRLPTGSAIKPLAVYAPALEEGLITPATVYEDSSIYPENDWRGNWPQNSSRSYSGITNVLQGVMQSLNTISVKVLQDLTVEKSYEFLTQRLGFTTLVEHTEVGGKEYTDIALAPLGLGELTYGMTVREMTQAYASFPNNGTFREARTYTQVVDAEGNVILDNMQESHTAMSEKTAFYINYMLRKVVEAGTGTPAYMNYMNSAGKTGTSNNNQTRWYAGYTPYYTAVVWCGYDQQEQVILSDSYTNPAIVMWRKVMHPLHDGLEKRSFNTPDSVGYYTVCSDCGLLATEDCKKEMRGDRSVVLALYWQDAPKEDCNCHIKVKVCKESGKVCNEFCEHVEGNTVDETVMLIFSKDWKVKKDEDYVYNEEKPETFCKLHTEESTKPTEPDPTEPIEPPAPPEPDHTPTPSPAPTPTPTPAPNSGVTGNHGAAPTVPNSVPVETEPSAETQWFERKIISGE